MFCDYYYRLNAEYKALDDSFLASISEVVSFVIF